MAWPKRLLDGMERAFNLDVIHHRRSMAIKDPNHFFEKPVATDKLLMGYILPPFQRPSVWSEAQQIRLVESAILGLGIGSFSYNLCQEGLADNTDFWLIDGQQRLRALDRYWNDEFPVFGLKWSEVEQRDQMRFLAHTMFPATETRIKDERILRELYDRLNFGGTPHTPDQKAVRDDETIDDFLDTPSMKR